jgi:peptide-methionine (S)-S-oxide reductase
MKQEKIYFGAGCFWGVEAEFRKLGGVISTRVGYMGGDIPNPTYEQVCKHETGHIETVEVVFDPGQITHNELLDLFWRMHDPTTLDRQGPDVGEQYKSVIFYTNGEQERAAAISKHKLEQSTEYKDKKIVTEIIPAPEFYVAEDYHQKYLEKQGLASCHINLAHSD